MLLEFLPSAVESSVVLDFLFSRGLELTIEFIVLAMDVGGS